MTNGFKRGWCGWIAHGILAMALVFSGTCGGAGKPKITPACAHSPCVVGSSLDPLCDPRCVAKICPGHPTCCIPSTGAMAWDPVCVDLVRSYCVQECDCAKTGMTGIPYNRYACDCTANKVCPADYSPCCDTGWDQTCVAMASQYYPNGCATWHP